MSIYGDIILDHFEYPRNKKRVENHTHAADVSNPLCGDELAMEAVITDGIVTDIGFHGEGCAISIASASILSEYALKKSVTELSELTSQQVLEMLKVELSPNRMKCGLLSWEALSKLIKSKSPLNKEI